MIAKRTKSEPDTRPRVPLKAVYLGRCMLAGNTPAEKEGVMLAHLDKVLDDPNSAEQSGSPFAFKGAPFSVIGGVYDISCVVENDQIVRYDPATVLYSGAKAQVSGSIIGAWEARDRAVSTRIGALRAEKRADADRMLRHHVQYLRMAYKKLGYQDRVPFKLWLFNELDKDVKD